jgi:hypothetical protein
LCWLFCSDYAGRWLQLARTRSGRASGAWD